MSSDAVNRCLTAVDANVCSYANGGEKRIAEAILELLRDVSAELLCSRPEFDARALIPPAFLPVIRHALRGDANGARRYVELLCAQFRDDGREDYAAKIEKQVSDVDNDRHAIPK